ncbi:MAG TPA: 2'-5' RNA ligase family protein [Bryobacteraceae bacterium]|nr:2'-5' RNA ligase family protein [Bryobacteraceae bacterium]
MDMMLCGDDGAQPVNCFALVTYIPGELGAFLDDLRRELVPGCLPRAHVTVLPPRALAGSTPQAIEVLDREIKDMAAFEIETRSVEVFEATSVIYIGLGTGLGELRRIHDVLNTGPLRYAEPFPYHPHITVAQEFEPSQVDVLKREAQRRWAEYTGKRSFPVESITFVQNVSGNRWLDLAHWTLGAVPTAR